MALADDADDQQTQLQAIGAEIWLARMARVAGDGAAELLHLEQASARCARAEQRWGAGGATLFRIVLAAERAARELALGQPEAALAALGHGLAGGLPAARQLPRPDQPADGLPLAAYRIAGVLFANQQSDAAETLLDRLAAYCGDAGDAAGAAAAYGELGDLRAGAGDGRGAWAAYRDGASALGDNPPDRAAALARARLLNSAGLAADQLGEFAIAAAAYAQVLAIRQAWLEPGDYELLQSRYNLAEIARVTGEADFAAQELGAVAGALLEEGANSSVPLLRLALKNRAQALVALGHPRDAEQAAVMALDAPAHRRPCAVSC